MLRVNSQTDQLLPEDTLHYAPAPPRRHRVLRRATWWVFGLAVTTFAIVWGWRAANQLYYLWLQHQLMNCNLPDGPMKVGSNGTVQNAPPWPPASKAISNLTSAYHPVFIHERVASNGTRRLIIVSDFVIPAGPRLTAKSCIPASVMPSSKLLDPSDLPFTMVHDAWTVHSGRVDPNDDSHFTIAYETDRGSGVIDGWLKDDGHLTLEVRDGPLR
jgi:hypothetical protein